jgi:hypothetical protein
MNCLGNVILKMMLLFPVRPLLLVLVLVAMMLTTPTTLSHLLYSLSCLLLLQLLMNSTRASSMMRSPCWRERSVPCTSSARRGAGHLGAASSAVISPTSLLTAPRGRSTSPPTSTTKTTTNRMTLATRVTARRSTALKIRRRRSSRRSCSERVLP